MLIFLNWTLVFYLEDFQPSIPQGKDHYAKATLGAHGTGGPLAVIEHCMLAGQEAGHKVNLDNNNGDPEGISIAQFNVDSGTRATMTELIVQNKQITRIEVLPTEKFGADSPAIIHIRNEVVLTAGCFQTPQLLLLSGIGPAKECVAHGIPLIQDLPAVGQNLQDHSALACKVIFNPSIPGHNQLLNDPPALEMAIEQYNSTRSGLLAVFGASAAIIFPKLPNLLASKEFNTLPASTKTFMAADSRLSTEIWMHYGPLCYSGPRPPDASVLVLQGLCQNNLSRGLLKLASSNPRDFPVIDPGYLSHPYDMKIAVETLREIVGLAQTPTFSSIIQSILLCLRSAIENNALAVISGADDDILKDFVWENLTQCFHAMSTCVMGKLSDRNKVVGNALRVEGVRHLRSADMSVCPILTSNYTQINAYLIGERCVEFILSSMSATASQTEKLRL